MDHTVLSIFHKIICYTGQLVDYQSINLLVSTPARGNCVVRLTHLKCLFKLQIVLVCINLSLLRLRFLAAIWEILKLF